MSSNRIDHLLLKNVFEKVKQDERLLVVLPHNSAEILYILTIVNTILCALILLFILANSCQQNGRSHITRRRVTSLRDRDRHTFRRRSRQKRKFTAVKNGIYRTAVWASQAARSVTKSEPSLREEDPGRDLTSTWGTVWQASTIASTPRYQNVATRVPAGHSSA